MLVLYFLGGNKFFKKQKRVKSLKLAISPTINSESLDDDDNNDDDNEDNSGLLMQNNSKELNVTKIEKTNTNNNVMSAVLSRFTNDFESENQHLNNINNSVNDSFLQFNSTTNAFNNVSNMLYSTTPFINQCIKFILFN